MLKSNLFFILWLQAIACGAEVIETRFTYDAADNLIVITDAENKETRFTYDNSNRKKSKTYPDTQVVTHDYDANGNLILTSLPNGTDITFDYDDLNRQYQQSYSGTLGTATVTLTLDGNGNVENVTESIDGQVHNTVMDYDNLDRLTLKTDRYNNTFIYTYDNNGNRKSFRDHTNISTSYNYDGLNRLKQLSRAGLGAFDWTYNAAGLPERIDYPNGSTANYSYDEANRIDIIDNRQSGVTVTSHDYDYDLNGNRTKLTESNIDAAQITSYTYDDADRLTQVNYPTSIHTYTLDKVGNRKSEVIDTVGSLNTRTYGYNTRDQLKTITDTDGLDISYDYDEAGNQTQKTENGVTTTFNYTPRQRVKTITVGGAPPVEYQYDYAGQRVNYQYNGAEKRYLYDGLTLIAETNTLGNTLATYHYGTTRQLAETRNGQNAFYLADALGTNVAITNQDGSIQNRMDYDVWGNLKQESASSDSPFGFTGYIKDEETDLYYANARYYDSFTGRFLREDPFEGDFNTPPSLHKYLYAHANPTYHIDPTGKCSIKIYRCQLFMSRSGSNSQDLDRLIKEYDKQRSERVGEPTTLAYVVGAAIFLGEGAVETGKFAADFIGNAFGHDGSEKRFSNRVGKTVDFLSNNPWETAQAALTDELYEIHLLEQAGKQTEANVRKGRLGGAFLSALTGPKAISSKKGGARRVEESADNSIVLDDIEVLTIKEARALDGENEGLIFVREPQGDLDKFYEQFDAGTTGAFSDVTSQKRAVPALRFDNRNPRGNNFVKFDGIEVDTSTVIDRKTSMTTRPKQISSIQRASEALKRNPDYNGVFEFPTQKAADKATDILFDNGIYNIEVRVAKNE